MLSPTRVRLVLSVLFLFLFFVLLLTRSAVSQSAQSSASSPSPQSTAPANPESAQPVASIRTTVHHVVVDVVATDKHGQPVRNLTERDFEIYERVGWTGKTEEKIASFRLVDKTAPAPKEPARPVIQVSPDSYSNLVATREPDQPLTIILIDELNTDMSTGDVRKQIMKMADSVVDFNMPTSVFLLSGGLQMLQNFNSDGKQLRSTIDTLMKAGPFGGKQLAFNLAPSPTMQQQLGVADVNFSMNSSPAPEVGSGQSGPSALGKFPDVKDLTALKAARDRDIRVNSTADALRAMARHLAGYPGRKKLVWISAAFPFSVLPSANGNDDPVNYRQQVIEATNALADANVAVYPISTGVWLPDLYDAARIKPPQPNLPGNPQSAFGDELTAQSAMHNSENVTFEEVANQTGGTACLGGNDLGFCLKNVLKDGYTYYELAYYPPSDAWKEGFHKITVRTTRSGVQLNFRRGYYAVANGAGNAGNTRWADLELKRSACDDALTATNIPLTVVPLGVDRAGVARYSVSVGTHAVAGEIEPESNAASHPLEFAVCTFNDEGRPLQFGRVPLEQGTGAASTKDVFQRIFAFNAVPHEKSLRWLVRDKETGALGSVDLPYQPAPDTEKSSENPNTGPVPANLEQETAPIVAAVEAADIPLPATSQPLDATAKAGNLPALDDDAKIASYCETLGRPGANADILAKVCEYALSLKGKLPDILCRRTAKAYGQLPIFATQRVVTEVAYLGGVEYDSDITAQSTKKGTIRFRRLSGSSSGGEFFAVQGIFLPSTNTDFRFEGEQVIDSVPALVFDYQVDRADNRLYALQADYLGGRSAISYPGYHGKLWIAKATSEILRLERETTDIAPRFPIDYASTAVEYSNVKLGDGSGFVLATRADDVACSSFGGKDCAHNLVTYDSCHKFKATSRIVDDVPPANAKQAHHRAPPVSR